MTSERPYIEITPTEWSTARKDRLTVRGPRTLTVAGKTGLVVLDLQAMPPEERYALARTIGKWCQRVEDQAVADIEAEAQAPLFD